MKYTIEHEIPGRIRVRLYGRVPEADVDALESLMTACPCVSSVNVYPRIGSLSVTFAGGDNARAAVLSAMDAVDAKSIEKAKLACPTALSVRTHSLLMDIALLVGSHFARKWFLPAPLRAIHTIWHYRLFLKAAVNSLLHARLDVPVLDAAAIGISFVMGDFATASSTMFLLDLGETLEDYTRARSENQLIYSLLGAPENAQLVCGDEEMTVPTANLKAGDLIAVRTGMPVSVDGVVERGVAMVNQSTLTGEPLAVERTVGDDVFAGTACEDGEIFVRVKAATGETKLRSIVSLVELSQSMKADVQTKRERLADRIVPWNFLLAGVVALTTRSLVKTSAALMVDYSCAQAHGVNLGFVRHEPGRQGGLHGEGVEAFRGIRPGRHDRLRQDRHAYRGATPGEMRYRARRMEPDPGPSLRGVLGRALPASRRARRRSRRS